MSAMPGLTMYSLWNRRGTAALTVFAIAVNVALLLGVQKLRTSAKESFATTISGTDLIVGARSGPINLLLYSVFRIGDPTANVTWETCRRVAQHRDVAWTIPLSLGDSHRGFRVVGILAPTGTPVDRGIHVDLQSIDAIHGGTTGARGRGPAGITAFLAGMKSRDTVLLMQRALNEYRGEPLQAVIPGVALTQLWNIVGIADRALLSVAACVALAGAVGGTALAYATMWLAKPWFSTRYGIHLATRGLTATDGLVLSAVVAAALLLIAIPAWRAYRNSLTVGMTVRL